MAHRLKEKGFTDVTILEKSNRVGGKAESFEYREFKVLVPYIVDYVFLD